MGVAQKIENSDPKIKETKRIADILTQTIGIPISEIYQLPVDKRREIIAQFGRSDTFAFLAPKDKEKVQEFLYGTLPVRDQRVDLQESLISVSNKFFGDSGFDTLADAILKGDTKNFINKKTKELAVFFSSEKSAGEFVIEFVKTAEGIRNLLDRIDETAPGGYGPAKDPTLLGKAAKQFMLLSALDAEFSLFLYDNNKSQQKHDASHLTSILRGEELNAKDIAANNNQTLTNQIAVKQTARALAEDELLSGKGAGLVYTYSEKLAQGGVAKGIAFLKENGYGRMWETQYANAKNYVESTTASYYINSVINKVDVAELSLEGRREEIGLAGKRTDSQRSKIVADSDERRQPKGEVKSEAPEDALKLAKKPNEKKPRNIAEEDESENA